MTQPSPLRAQMTTAAEAIRTRTSVEPTVGVVLGTGLGALAREIEVETTIPYGEIPGFPLSTVESHSGNLLLGTLSGQPVVAMQGRFHLYEGYSMGQITFPIRVMHALGVRTLLVSNACGGLNPLYRKGDVMLIEDHINLLGDNPLIGPNDDTLGPRFPDMSEPYSRRLLGLAEQAALELKLKVQRGVYAAMSGPTLETRAEYRMLRGMGADVIGMSTIPECIVANHMGMEVLGISVITDECFPDALQPVNVTEIIAAANEAEPKMTAIFRTVAGQL